jgi:hypothetical protein
MNSNLQIPLHLYCGVICVHRIAMFKRIHYGVTSRKVAGSIPDELIKTIYVISSFCCGLKEILALLGCYVA